MRISVAIDFAWAGDLEKSSAVIFLFSMEAGHYNAHYHLGVRRRLRDEANSKLNEPNQEFTP
jgi:hypothetical protein